MKSPMGVAALLALALTSPVYAFERDWYDGGDWWTYDSLDMGGHSCVAVTGDDAALAVVAYLDWSDPVLFWRLVSLNYPYDPDRVVNLRFDGGGGVFVPAEYDGSEVAIHLDRLEPWRAAAIMEALAASDTLLIYDGAGEMIGEPSLVGSRGAITGWFECADALGIPLRY